MIQLIAILILFSGAAFFLGRMIYRSFQAKNACSTGCGKCGAVDFQKVEDAINKKFLPTTKI